MNKYYISLPLILMLIHLNVFAEQKDVFSEVEEVYREYVQDFIENDFDGIASHFSVPVKFNSLSKNAKTIEDVKAVYRDMKNNIQEGYSYSTIDSIKIYPSNDLYIADVIYSRFNDKNELLFTGNTLYEFINVDENWKMISLSSKDIPQQKSSVLVSALEHTVRSEKNMARDEFRHPYETLTFFGISPAMKVIELSPGGGWYTEIFASYLEQGNLIAAHHDPNSKSNYRKRSRARFEEKLSKNPIYDSIKLVNLNGSLAEPSSVDAVVTFRNLHNWIGSSVDSIFKNSFTALKSGGILGVVEHRAPSGTSVDSMKKSGYVTENYAIEAAQNAGFVMLGKSEINSNPKDTADHPKGVWTLPPNLRLKDQDREKYLAIGESDRMTLLFRKP